MEIVISIHAPTRGATVMAQYALGKIAISIHAPTRGATVTSITTWKAQDISIHAPTRGATNWDWIQKARLIFQSTLLQEERHAE